MNGKAWIIPYDGIPPKLPDDGKWMVFRLGMAFLGRDKCENGVPNSFLVGAAPSFFLVATDREAAKAEIIEKFDDMVDCLEDIERRDALENPSHS